VLELDGLMYRLIATHKKDERARVKPFDAIELDLAVMWKR
jgi:hypothetical protein